MNRNFETHNRASRERLRAMIVDMSDEELSLPTVAGWTVSAALAHIAFWDFRIHHLLERWQAQDVITSPYDVDALNAAHKPLALALAPRPAADLAVRAAAELDSLIESTPDALVEKIRRAGVQFKFERNEHREYHLVEIEHALQAHRAARA